MDSGPREHPGARAKPCRGSTAGCEITCPQWSQQRLCTGRLSLLLLSGLPDLMVLRFFYIKSDVSHVLTPIKPSFPYFKTLMVLCGETSWHSYLKSLSNSGSCHNPKLLGVKSKGKTTSLLPQSGGL